MLTAIRTEYADEVVACPVTEIEWLLVSDMFQDKWNVPHACGALDGKHIAIRCPPKSGSEYFNYKKFYSIVLMALVDADYKFLWVDVGGTGRMSDAQIFNASELKECIENRSINLPHPDPLPNDDKDTPYFFLGDDAFALRTYMMKPYSIYGMSLDNAVFNYRISRGRRVVENAFGIMANRWRILLTTMMQTPDTCRLITEVCVILHNLMRLRHPGQQNILLDQEAENYDLIPGEWRRDANMLEVDQLTAPNMDTMAGKKQREYLKLYFGSPAGQVHWQERMIPGHR